MRAEFLLKYKLGAHLNFIHKKKMRLLESTEKSVTIDKNGENVLSIEITEVVLVHGNVVGNSYQ